MASSSNNGDLKEVDCCCTCHKTDPINGYSYEEIKAAADHILNSTKYRPKIGVICGSGLGGIADSLTDSEVFPYDSIPLLPSPTVISHAGRAVIGKLNGIPLMCMQGRSHYYEGHPTWMCALPVRIMKLMGIENLIVTNAAGGINENYKLGDIMLYKDHIFLHLFGGETPLRGPNEERFGPRFPAMNKTYNKILRQAARQAAVDGGFAHQVHEGTFSMASGPAYETPAELKALKILGSDSIGMSGLPEVMVARHCDMRVFAFCLIVDVGIMDPDAEDEMVVDVDAVGKMQMKNIIKMITSVVNKMNE